MINYEMPFLLTATWKVISAFIGSDDRQKVLLLKKRDLAQYVPEAATWWPHMK